MMLKDIPKIGLVIGWCTIGVGCVDLRAVVSKGNGYPWCTKFRVLTWICLTAFEKGIFCDGLPLLALVHSNASEESEKMTLRFVLVGTLDTTRYWLNIVHVRTHCIIVMPILIVLLLLLLLSSSSSSLVIIEVCELLTFQFATTCTHTTIIVTKEKKLNTSIWACQIVYGD